MRSQKTGERRVSEAERGIRDSRLRNMGARRTVTPRVERQAVGTLNAYMQASVRVSSLSVR